MKRLWMVLALSWSTTMAGELTLVIPQVSKSDGVPADGDPLHAQYEAAWAKYEQAIAGVVTQVTEALDREFNKAADAGSLDSADKWDKKKKAFLDTHTITVEVPDKPKRPPPKKPKGDAAPSFEEVLEAAQQETNSAFLTLKRNYENLVTEYTKDRNLDRAKALRDELAGLARKSAERPTMVEMKPSRVTQMRLKHAPDAVAVDGHFYKVFWGTCSWHEARKRCEMVGGYLTCLETRDEKQKVATLKGDGKVVWVGGLRNEKGQFVWINGQPINTHGLIIEGPQFSFISYTGGGNLITRSASGTAEGSKGQDIQGFICEWDE